MALYRFTSGLWMSFTRPAVIFISWISLFLLFGGCGSEQTNKSFLWPEMRREYKPGVYMHLMGSAANEKDMERYLSGLHGAGIGGILVIPIYGVEGDEENYIPFLSPRWMGMLEYTTRLGDSLDINIDMTTGTGWPFGGSHVTPEDAALKIEMEKHELKEGERAQLKIDTGSVVTVDAYGPEKRHIDLMDRVLPNGLLEWSAPEGRWTVYILRKAGTGQMVKRAAPGNEGLVINPFSEKSMQDYLERFDSAFSGYTGRMPRSQYHDSYEYYGADWVDGIFKIFQNDHGYDLREYLPELFDGGRTETGVRVKADFRETMAGMHLKYIRKWVQWSHEKGMITRNEGHGAPANWLDLYSASDIPETEIFGSTPFKIPGWKRLPENNSNSIPLNPLILRFASSAAHVSGKKLVASETLTWLRDHFRSTLWQAKPEIDRLFLSGINHIYYHGSAYSPAKASWPGWLFYASVHYQPQNALWRDIDQLNAYAARCQSVLQSGTPDNDILLYWPLEDVWHRYPDVILKGLNVHDIEWFTNSEFGRISEKLWKKGYTFDYISGDQILEISVNDRVLKTEGAQYKTIVIPATIHMPVDLWERLIGLAREGATVIVHKFLPLDVPGFSRLELRQAKLKALNDEVEYGFKKRGNHRESYIGKGRILLGDDLNEMLAVASVEREPMADEGLEFIRRRHGEDRDYFVSNLTSQPFDGWLQLAVPFESAILMNPLESDQAGTALVRSVKGRQEVYLQLMPGASMVLRTFTRQKTGAVNWTYYIAGSNGITLGGTWEVRFIQGGPEIPKSFHTDKLLSWTAMGDSAALRFAGTARYRLEFELEKAAGEDWLLDLGKVCESARIRINGKYAGTLWSIPFSKRVGKYLKQGKNTLEIEVTNMSANRIRDLDRRDVNWKKFFFVNVHYKPFDASGWPLADSGLLGPVQLIPLRNFFIN